MLNEADTYSKRTIQTTRASYQEGRNEQGERVLIQSAVKSTPSLEDMFALKNDFEITHAITCDGVLASHKLIKKGEGIVIIKDFFDGVTLTQYLKKNRLDITSFLSIAIKLSHILEQIHSKKIIHKDINPDNILISPDARYLTVCNFNIATQLDQEQQELRLNESARELLTHISPEQTGRMNRSIDYRSDLYSLGVTFYEVLCNRLPFDYDSIIELIHAHIARYPVKPSVVDPGIPETISAIVMKLLSKNAEDRYQSASGLKTDLEECLRQWQAKGKIEKIELATHDNSTILCISEKIYGREKEINKLVEAFERTKYSPPEMILVSGYSGIGKTRLINEIDKPIAAYDGHFASGKFDQYQRDTPYSVFNEAIGFLIKQILSESEANLAKWRSDIMVALEGNGQVLIDIIPDLELLIGKQQPVLKLGLNETNARFCSLFQKFLAVLSGTKNHLVIFIDDLQWADSGSLDLLHKTLLNTALKNVLLIGAFRDNEVNPSHPLMLLLERLEEQAPGKTSIITLDQLDHEIVNLFIADSLRLKPESTHELTGLIMNKTRGNPFFIKQFVKKMATDGLIYFDSRAAKWNWDYNGIMEMDVTENVVDLLVGKIRKIPESSKKVLVLASCIGNSFDTRTLAIISELSESKLADILWTLVKDEYIKPGYKWNKHSKDDLWKEFGSLENNTKFDIFQFQHDRIQQAAYSLNSENDKKTIHLRIGTLLLEKFELSDQEISLFEMLGHLNFSSELITDEKERIKIAELNFQAGDKAKRSNAYQPALIFFKAGMDLIAHADAADLSKKMLLARCETEYLCGNYRESEALFDKALGNAKNNIEKAQVLANKMSLYENTNQQLEAIKIALAGLRYVGVDLPEKTGPVDILIELMKVKFHLRNKTIDKLKENENMDSAEVIVAMKILVNLWGPAYLYNQNLLALAILRMVNLSIRYGNSPESALAYAFYGFLCSGQFQDYKTGLEFARFGMWLNEKFEDKTLRSKVYVIYAGCVAHWAVKCSELMDVLRVAHEVGVESNDLIYASYAFSFYGERLFFMGVNLLECRNQVDKFIHFCRQIQFPLNIHYMMTLGRAIYNLTDTPPDKSVFMDSADVTEHVRQMKEIEAKDGTNLFLTDHNLYQGMISYHLCRYDEAVGYFNAAKKTIVSIMGMVSNAVFKCYLSLSMIANAQLRGSMTSAEKSFVRSSLKFFSKIDKTCPDNFRALNYLLTAEWANHNKDRASAAKAFGDARKWAKEMGPNIQALANERSARFYYESGMTDLADVLLREAYTNNKTWGAVVKTNQLKTEFPDFHFPEQSADAPAGTGENIADSASWIDLQSIFKASTTISGEIVFEKLVEKLLKIIIENAGAQKIFLILNEEGTLKAAAFADNEDHPVKLLNGTLLEHVHNLSHSVVQFVFHTDETIILNDAADDSRFSKDIYIESQKPKSILCLPIKKHGITTAILYLENNIATGTFTPAMLKILNLLSGQIAISLENSMLYETLEQKVADRTETIENQKRELEDEKGKSDALLLNILPYETAEELKRTGSYKPRKYDNVSIIFTDFVEFTKLSEKLSTEDLVEMIDNCYSGFDRITTKHNVEKIKTIGDSYMCVSGLPVETPDHAINAVNAARDMLAFIEQFNAERKAKNLPFCPIRLGIHSGPVAAGVVGSKKFAYDIWSDSVNVAARLESAGEGGKINISDTTYELVKNKFKCTYRGKIHVKNKGEIDMYFVNE